MPPIRNIARALSTTVATLPLLLLAACSPDPGRTADGRTIITFWTSWAGFEKGAIDELIEDFHAAQDEIYIKSLNISDPSSKIMLATASGNPPDVVLMSYYDIAAYAANNALTPLDPLCRQAGITRDRFIPIFWDTCTYQGVLWALPITASVTALHYNKKVFRDAGLDPSRPPQTLEELERFNEQIAERGEDGSLSRLGHHPNEPGWWLTDWGLWFGADRWDGESRMTLDSPEWLAAGRWLESYPERFGADDLTKLKSGFGKFASPNNPFFTGKVGMVMQGIWMDNFIKNYASVDFDYGVAPFPASVTTDLPYMSIAEPDTVAIPRGAKHVTEAFEFVAFMAQQENVEKLALLHRKITSQKAVSRPFLENHPHPFVETFIEIAASPYARTRLLLPQFQNYQSDMTNALDNILAGRSEPAEALQKAQQSQQAALELSLRRWSRVAEARREEWSDLVPE